MLNKFLSCVPNIVNAFVSLRDPEATLRRVTSFGIICTLISVISVYAQEESITITTYYPSPYGSYNELTTNELTTTGNTYLATTSGTVGIGTTSPSLGAKLELEEPGARDVMVIRGKPRSGDNHEFQIFDIDSSRQVLDMSYFSVAGGLEGVGLGLNYTREGGQAIGLVAGTGRAVDGDYGGATISMTNPSGQRTFQVDANGWITATGCSGCVGASDVRLKTNVAPRLPMCFRSSTSFEPFRLNGMRWLNASAIRLGYGISA